MAKKVEKIEDRLLCQGVMLSHTFFEKKENRLLTLLLKGFIVYLLTMGSIGFYLSALDIEYNVLLCHVVILVMAVLCACLYYRLLIENLGYLLMLVLFGALVFMFRTYINSGFYAVVNVTVDMAAQFFDVDIQRLYNEQISNRYVTVTFMVLFIGIVLDVFLNVYISRRMQYFTAIMVVMSLNLIPLYMIFEPDMLYTIMLLAGIAMAYVFRSGRHYSPQVIVKRSSYVFEEKGKENKKKKTKKQEAVLRDNNKKKRRKKTPEEKREISYVYNVKAMTQMGLLVAVFVFLVVVAVSTIKPKETFNFGYEENKYKKLTRTGVSAFLMEGWSAFARFRDDVGGMNSGKLGDVSSIRLDYQTDLVVRYTPYSYDMVYLKNFTGVIYNPYENCWTSIYEVRDWYWDQTPEADAYKTAYENDEAYTAKGKMIVECVGVAGAGFIPYYSADYDFCDSEEGNIAFESEYYPKIFGNETFVSVQNYENNLPYTDADLYIPPENIEAIEYLVSQLDYLGSTEQIITALQKYYQENIPYTIRPGKTPRREDFINYFLLDNKKGYCSHYASAAVLLFRYFGIPARYVEGYAIDYGQVINGELVEGAEYEDYYDGYSALGETALVEINVTDADAHAWVEVYEPEKGWYVVEVTPAGEVEEVEDFWTMFDDLFGETEETTDMGVQGPQLNFKISDELIKKICLFVLGLFGVTIAVVIIIKGRKYIIKAITFKRANLSDKLIMKYSDFYKYKSKKNKELARKLNYREQITLIDGQAEDIICILEQAGFSNIPIQQEDYEKAITWMQNNKKPKE